MKCDFKPTDYVHAVKSDKRYYRCSRAECSNGIFLSPSQFPAPVKCRHPSIGAGDAVAIVAAAVGIKKTPGCNCEQRQRLMNAVLPELKKPRWLSWFQGAKKQLPPDWQIRYSPMPSLVAKFLAMFKNATAVKMENR